jgi:sulfate/thiosulfate transport system permease protein
VTSEVQTLGTPRPEAQASGRSWLSGVSFGRWGLRGAALLYLGLAVALPLAAVAVRGFSDGLTSLAGALSSQGAWAALQLTLVSSAIVAVVNGVFGTILAYVLVRFRFPGKAVLAALVDLPFAIPTLVTGVMLVALYGPASPFGQALGRIGIGLIFTPLGITMALLVVTLPLVVRTVEPVLLELDPAEEEAAQVLGASPWVTFRSVVLPALRPAIAAGALLSFARALGEFGSIVVVAGNITGKTLTAPVFIFQLTSQFRYAEAAAVSSLLLVISGTLVLVTERLVSTRRDAP